MPYKELSLEDELYPNLLSEIPDPPGSIHILGDTNTLSNKSIAIVGTRKASQRGKEIAFDFAKRLSQEGFNIISGLALGIDGAAHRGALEHGKTVAVLGTAISNLYPKEHVALAEKISQNGAVISEYGQDEPTDKEDFLKRNRIISGLSLAVVVIEAPMVSGALSTARHAGEQGRLVFVVPGSIDDPNYVGSHDLIRDGAILVKSAEDVLEDVSA